MHRFLVKKTGDCGSPSTPKKPKADSERLVAARVYEDRRRRGLKAAWRDEFAWLTYGRLRLQRRTGRRTGRYRFRVFECDIAHADQTTKRLAALAVPLVMLVYQTRRIAVATRDSES